MTNLRSVIAAIVLVCALLWPVAGDPVAALLAGDEQGCPHSGDLPDRDARAQLAGAVLCLLNAERTTRGLPALARDERLARSAQAHAEDMGRRRFYAHENPSGLSPDQRMREAGFDGSATGENILRASFTRVGIGVASEPPRFGAGHVVGVYVQNLGGQPSQKRR